MNKKIAGWMMFDWASQPYNTLIITFIFGPYFASAVVGDPVEGQSLWAIGSAVAGLLIAVLAPILGAFADSAGRRMPYIWLFSALYVVGACALWGAIPGASNVILILILFGIGLIGMEFATIFTNAMLPELGAREKLGSISGTGWAVGYVGGLISLAIMLLFFAENEAGVTFLGQAPVFGLDAATREGTRSVGPLTALWYALFMIPFFLWVREKPRQAKPANLTIKQGLGGLRKTIIALPKRKSLMSFLGASMLYRDALNGVYTFGGIYAGGVLGWSVVDIGVFGILAVVTGAVFAWLGGKADVRFGPKPVIVASIVVLTLSSIGVVLVTRQTVFGIAVPSGSALPDLMFYVLGCCIGAAGGMLQAASRTMLVRQGNPSRMTEAFGLYAVAGKATAWLAPALIFIFTTASESQRIGITPVILLFLLGLLLLFWVKAEGEDEAVWNSEST